MKYVRIKTYYPTGKATGCDQCYAGDDIEEAADRFYREYPEHREMNIKAQIVDDQDEKWTEYFAVARRCGCVHFW